MTDDFQFILSLIVITMWQKGARFTWMAILPPREHRTFILETLSESIAEIAEGSGSPNMTFGSVNDTPKIIHY